VSARARTQSRSRPRHARAGFTLVEVVFAVILLSIGLLAIAGLGLATSRLTRNGGTQTVAATVAQARFDSIASLPCLPFRNAGVTTGSPTAYRGIQERWVITAGLYRINIVDTLRLPGRTRPLIFKSVLPCR
jgi:prepilin-type N-terminal cleavage/methylation domain-containing protein